MTLDNWINLIAASLVGGGTLFLGIMALRTIRQTRSIQKTEKKERLLNEIIEWAINYSVCYKIQPSAITRDKALMATMLQRGIGEIISNLDTTKMRTDYIQKLSLKGLKVEVDLQTAIKPAKENIEEYVKLLEHKLKERDPSRQKEIEEQLASRREQFATCANKVLAEIIEIKSRLLGAN